MQLLRFDPVALEPFPHLAQPAGEIAIDVSQLDGVAHPRDPPDVEGSRNWLPVCMI
jgi:hypothetical protein